MRLFEHDELNAESWHDLECAKIKNVASDGRALSFPPTSHEAIVRILVAKHEPIVALEPSNHRSELSGSGLDATP